MSNQRQQAAPESLPPLSLLEKIAVFDDLNCLTYEERTEYYDKVCDSLGLNKATKPLEYIELDGKLVLYARKDATDQLRRIYEISVEIVSREMLGGLYVVTARAKFPDGRVDESIGAVPTEKEGGEWKDARSGSGKRYFKSNGIFTAMKGRELANAIMRAETKAKRRVTLSIAGLGMLDESEVDVPKGATVRTNEVVDPATGEITSPATTQTKPVSIDPRSIPEAVKTKLNAVITRAKAANAWTSAREWVEGRLNGRELAYALSEITKAEAAANPAEEKSAA